VVGVTIAGISASSGAGDVDLDNPSKETTEETSSSSCQSSLMDSRRLFVILADFEMGMR
jgi:hypothetical protein